jgi:hypothetical protein
MVPENRFYGHASILARYAGVERAGPLPVRIQHGWTPGEGLWPHEIGDPLPKLLWSARNLQQCQASGYDGVVGFGSPFIYLPAAEQGSSQGARSLLAVPFHGWEKERLAANMDVFVESLSQLEADGFAPITVCLYWFEYENPEFRAAFERRGYRTVSAGRRDDNPDFLIRLREHLLAHAYVTSNRVSTAAFYALYLGRPFFLWGPPAGLSGSDDPNGTAFDAWQRQEFPSLRYETFRDAPDRALGEAELGLEFLHTPAQVRELLLMGAGGAARRCLLRARRELFFLRRRLVGPGQ